jgi:hypothetical protein
LYRVPWNVEPVDRLRTGENHAPVAVGGDAPEFAVDEVRDSAEAQRQRQAAGLYDTRHFSEADFKRLLFEYTYPRLGTVLRDQGKPYPELDGNGAFTTGEITK